MHGMYKTIDNHIKEILGHYKCMYNYVIDWNNT